MTLRAFVEKYWRPYLERKSVKLYTRTSYESALTVHLLPSLGGIRIGEIVPLHIEVLLQAKLKSGLAPKTVRNLIGLLQGIFSLAEDNDLIGRSPVRNKHKPSAQRREKPTWTANQVRLVIDAVPTSHRALFATAGLQGHAGENFWRSSGDISTSPEKSFESSRVYGAANCSHPRPLAASGQSSSEKYWHWPLRNIAGERGGRVQRTSYSVNRPESHCTLTCCERMCSIPRWIGWASHVVQGHRDSMPSGTRLRALSTSRLGT